MTEKQDQLQNILMEKLKKLNRYDLISVTWVDASQSHNVSVKTKIPNHAVETKVVSEGRFLCIQEGETYTGFYLIMVKDITENERATIQSIPLSLVREVNRFDKIQLMSRPAARAGTMRIRYDDGIVKVVRIKERH